MQYIESDFIPPAIPLLMSEVFQKAFSYEDAIKNLKKVLPELKKQSIDYQNKHKLLYPENISRLQLNIVPDSGMNLFDSSAGHCTSLHCRLKNAKNIVRSLGLIADTIWFTDCLTEKFCDFGRLTNKKLKSIIDEALVIAELIPLIYAGIIKFRTPWLPFESKKSLESYYNFINDLALDTLKDYDAEFTFEKMDENSFAVHTGNLFSPIQVVRFYKNKKLPNFEDAKFYIVQKTIHDAFWSNMQAGKHNGVLFSNSQLGMSVLAKQEQRISSISEVQSYDAGKLINIPWVSELNAAQILNLRTEADKALPAFREVMATHFSYSNKKESINNIVYELREQATLTRNELENVRKHSSKWLKTTYATLSFGLSAYGALSGDVIPAVASLLPAIQLAIDDKNIAKDLDLLQRKASYVLVKAQDILAHDH